MKDKLIFHEAGKDPLYKTWHASSSALFMYVYTGSGSVVTKDRSYPIQSSTLILIKPGTYHYTLPDRPESYVRSKLVLSFSKYVGLMDLLCAHAKPQTLLSSPVAYARIPPEAQAAVDRFFAEAASCENAADNALLLLSGAMRMLFFLNQYGTARAPAPGGFISAAIQYINENIALELSLDKICAAVNVSKYHFCRQFKLQLGMTVMQYILNTRIILAGDELKKNALPVTRISEKYGFSSVSYFCRVFKEKNGCSPREYRHIKESRS